MPKTRQQKEAELKEFQDKLSRLASGGLFFVNYRGLTAAKMRRLRREIKRAGGEMTVLKKTLARLGFEKAGIPANPTTLEGELGFVFGYADPLATAKTIYQAFRQDDKPVILGGWFEGRMLTAKEVITLATLPGRQELLARLVSTMAQPMRGLVSTLAEVMAGFVRVLDAKARSLNHEA